MDALQLLREWPCWARAGAQAVLDSPAWRRPVKWNDGAASLTRLDGGVGDSLDLDVSFDGEAHVLGIGDSPAFPDLHLLWASRGALPREVLLALVEKECGALFQLLEDVFRRQFSVLGLAEPREERGDATAFHLEGRGVTLDFELDLPPVFVGELGRLDDLDPLHESIRAMTREAEADYGTVPLDAAAVDALAVGDFVLLPEGDGATWEADAAADGECHLRGAESAAFTFAQFADGALPPVPPPSSLKLVVGGKVAATGVLAQVGLGKAMKITAL